MQATIWNDELEVWVVEDVDEVPDHYRRCSMCEIWKPASEGIGEEDDTCRACARAFMRGQADELERQSQGPWS